MVRLNYEQNGADEYGANRKFASSDMPAAKRPEEYILLNRKDRAVLGRCATLGAARSLADQIQHQLGVRPIIRKC